MHVVSKPLEKLSNEEKNIILNCVKEGVDFINKIMNKCDMKNNHDEDYIIKLSDLKMYINEFVELAKDNKAPFIEKLYNECVSNIEKFFIVQCEINEEKKKLNILNDQLRNTKSKDEYLEFTKNAMILKKKNRFNGYFL
jgi:FtsZ-binding cell division protein ZapB